MKRIGMTRNRPTRRGFTLIEIILVVLIIMTLAAVVGPRLTGRARDAKINSTRIQMQGVKSALQEFEIYAGRFPTSAEGLEALVNRPSGLTEDEWPDKYLDRVPTDSFGQPFQYTYPSEHGMDYDLVSAGPDKNFGTEDDITNYSEEEGEGL